MSDITIHPLISPEPDKARHYKVIVGAERYGVRVWDERDGKYVSTQIGGPKRITAGRYVSDDDAIVAHFTEPHEDQLRALAHGIEKGWQYASAWQGTGDPWASVWLDARFRAEAFYPNGWNGGERSAECRAAFQGGWAIGVQRFSDGVAADGTPINADNQNADGSPR